MWFREISWCSPERNNCPVFLVFSHWAEPVATANSESRPNLSVWYGLASVLPSAHRSCPRGLLIVVQDSRKEQILTPFLALAGYQGHFFIFCPLQRIETERWRVGLLVMGSREGEVFYNDAAPVRRHSEPTHESKQSDICILRRKIILSRRPNNVHQPKPNQYFEYLVGIVA